ncbi:MAG: hypothetical protein JWM57_1446 [Phycisphaerales bacterium]|nr:hypothetical protein [Phycisphaerales bacterium]
MLKRYSTLFAMVTAAWCAQAHAETLAPAQEPVATTQRADDSPSLSGTETIVFLRHGEKPPGGLGQLSPQGLNRAIALAKVLPAKFGKPDYIFAPDPGLTKVHETKESKFYYYYVRPLMTIEPTAIALGMPVQTPFGFAQIDQLNSELTSGRYANATIFIAWEHGNEQKAVANLVRTFGADPAQVPVWKGEDFDSLYVVTITRRSGKTPVVQFKLDHENLNNLSKEMPR